ncbi:L,D-transpeptidase [Mangrovicella endophytica]|uniref:L,D-transpeptidase n=1 Tax=Mangrovicella endophytica TaxID=2066697 RepID=UPI000C9E1903|nr:L,D-transpeptidase [Mangrovicella endophytica]
MRKLSIAAASLVLAAFGGMSDAVGRDRGQPAVQVSPDLAQEWLLQLSPGSGIVRGYTRPHLAEPAAASARSGVVLSVAPAEVTYAAAVPGRARIVTRSQAGVKPRQARAVPAARSIDPAYLPQDVDYITKEAPGTLVIDTRSKFLYQVGENGRARRYGVGVGKPGFAWAGTHKVTAKREWPDWRPPAQMIAREKKKGKILPVVMKGGEENPLGARAMYLGSTLYRIHGTNQPWSIGKAVSSGCIRMRNQDVEELYETVGVGTRVVVM